MNCRQYRTEIEESDSAADRLSARAESHAASCARCRDFAGEAAALRGLVAGLPRVDAPADFEFRLRARIGAADPARSRPWSRTLLPRAAALAGAGCLALAAALALLTRDSETPGEQEPKTLETVAQKAAAQPPLPQPAANSVAAPGAEAASGDKTDGAGVRASANPTSASGETVLTRRGAGAAPAVENVARARQRRHASVTATQPLREAAAPGVARAAPTETNTSSMTGGPVVVSSAIPLPVSADEQPLQVLFKDMQGASRVVNVAPVAFGSNEPEAKATNVTYTKTTKKQGVW